MRKLDLEPGNDGQSQRVANESREKIIQGEEEGRRNGTKLWFTDTPDGKEHLETQNEAPILDGVNYRRNLESDGWSSGEKKEVVLQTLEKVFWWRVPGGTGRH